MRKSRLFFYSLLLLPLFISSASAHKAKEVHPFKITGKAWELLRTSMGYDEMGNYFYDSSLPPGYQSPTYDKSKILKQGTLATAEEDNFLSNWFGEVPFLSWLNHFYNPIPSSIIRT